MGYGKTSLPEVDKSLQTKNNHAAKSKVEKETPLRDQGAGGGALVSPGGGEDTDGLVVAGQTVDTGLDQNETELAVLVLAVALKVLADGNGLKKRIST